jgi:hypothetical protein
MKAIQLHCARSLNFVALEQVIFLTLRAVRALQTANQEYRHTNRDKDGEYIRVSLQPMDKSNHRGFGLYSGLSPSANSEKPGLYL